MQSEDPLPLSHIGFAPGLLVSVSPTFLWFTSKVSFQQEVCAVISILPVCFISEAGSYQLLGRTSPLSLGCLGETRATYLLILHTTLIPKYLFRLQFTVK